MTGRKILKNWSFLAVSNLVQQGLNFLVLIPIARAMDLPGYGIFTLILTTIGIAQIVAALGMRPVVIREVARGGSDLAIIAKRTFSLSILGFLATSIPLILYLRLVETITNPILLLISAMLLLAQIIWNFAEPLTFGKEQMQFSSVIGGASAILWCAAVFLLPGLIMDLPSLLGLYLAVQSGRSLAYLFVLLRRGYFRAAPDADHGATLGYQGILSRSLPLYLSSLLAASITQLPVLFLSGHSGPVELAYYGLGSRLSIPFIVIYSNLLNAIYPLLAKLHRERENASFAGTLGKLFVAVWILGIAISFLLSLFGGEIITNLFGTKFAAATPTFAILLWVTLNHLIHSCMGLVFLAADRERLLVKLSVFNGLVTGVAAYIGSFHGAEGLAIATYLGLSASYLVHWHYVGTVVRIPIRRALLYAFYAAYAGLGIGSMYFRYLQLPVKLVLFCAAAALLFLAYSRYKSPILALLKADRK